MVSIFTYYCAKSFFAHSGGFIRGLNCSSGYGEIWWLNQQGTLATETVVSVQSRGDMLSYNSTLGFVGEAAGVRYSDCIKHLVQVLQPFQVILQVVQLLEYSELTSQQTNYILKIEVVHFTTVK